jgi:prepilin-type N-terminal cleavage/methylation domain-containing protein
MQPDTQPRAQRTSRRPAGFTLIELMVVVATIGVISAIAIPSLQKYVWRAQRNEAYLNLNGIYKAQVSYFTDTGAYADSFNALGFEILGGQQLDPQTIQSQYYTYTLDAFANTDGLANGNFQAVATGDPDPTDAILDILMIENDIIILD